MLSRVLCAPHVALILVYMYRIRDKGRIKVQFSPILHMLYMLHYYSLSGINEVRKVRLPCRTGKCRAAGTHLVLQSCPSLSHSLSLSRSLTMWHVPTLPWLCIFDFAQLQYIIARPRHCPRHQSQWVRTTGTCRCYLSTTVRQVATVSHAGTFPLLLTTCTCMVDQRRGKYILQSTHACTPNDLMSLSAAGG